MRVVLVSAGSKESDIVSNW